MAPRKTLVESSHKIQRSITDLSLLCGTVEISVPVMSVGSCVFFEKMRNDRNVSCGSGWNDKNGGLSGRTRKFISTS